MIRGGSPSGSGSGPAFPRRRRVSAERFVDPEVSQAVEELEDALKAERRALGPLPGENAELGTSFSG